MELKAMEGQIIADRFRLQKMVGKGGYGAVFKATQLSVGRTCAVKILLPGRCDDEAVEKRFRAEGRTTSRLTHPHSLVLYDFGVDDATGFLFLATEFLDGHTLDRLLKLESTLEVGRTVSILRQIGASLADAHGHGLVHRDIKPKNIMLVHRAGQRDFVKVIDFGIAKTLHADLGEEGGLTRTGMMLGTPQYMAPEQLLASSVDGRTDQYALAVVGYRMLTGRNPFRAGAAMETAMRHINDRPMPLRAYRPDLEVNADFEDAFLKALQKSPEHRFDRITEFINAIIEACEGVDLQKTAEESTCQTVAMEAENIDGEQARRDDGNSRGRPPASTIDARARADIRETESAARSELTSYSIHKLWVVATSSLLLFGAIVGAIVVASSPTAVPEEEALYVAEEAAAQAEEPPAEPVDSAVGDEANTVSAKLAFAVDEGMMTAGRAAELARSDADARAERLRAPAGVEGGGEADSDGGASAGPARLTVTLIPWGTLYVDGEPKSNQTRQSVTLSPGEYELTLRQQGKVRARRLVDVNSGESKMVVLEADFTH